MNRNKITWLLHGGLMALLLFTVLQSPSAQPEPIPLPEHPRPDFERAQWINLNGTWKFHFDAKDQGIQEEWFMKTAFEERIVVPFPWGSKLSQVDDKADIVWYARTIQVPKSWEGQRVFFIIGACDWHTTVWLDGQKVGEHQGGYTPFEFELTSMIQVEKEHELVIRVDDTRRMFTLYGKQGYGNARGIWQTPYLEARGKECLKTVHFAPDIDAQTVTAKIVLLEPAQTDLQLEFSFKTGNLQKPVTLASIAKGTQEVEQLIPIPNPRLWSLDDPFLYEVTVSVRGNPMIEDRVSTYFGMRKVSVVNLPGTEFPYVALNNKPVYMQLTLDQAYHPDGFYTFPTDAFTRDEILRSKSIGLNGMRVHIKVPLTRKLYWADKLGMLIMADLPNSWGAPDADARQESEYTLKAMIERDFNHPSIFSWITFNETWGLKTDNKYLPETQKWVGEMVTLAKTLDPTRLVEDNSACNYDHVTPTDLNTWHAYLPGYEWMDFLANACKNTYEGSTWNFAEGYKQGKQPMFNSECGNVWGYEGSAGDVDWSWDYHLMMNAFRRFPQCAGWLYTEHHDVINEWNGYWRYDRSEKYTGMEELAPGMTLNDLHGAFYLVLSEELCQDVKPGDTVKVPVFASFMSDRPASNLQIQWTLRGWTRLGETAWYDRGSREVPYTPWMNKELEPITVQMPQTPGLAILTVALVDGTQTVLHRNFTTFVVKDGAAPRDEKIHVDGKNLRVLRVAPQQFNDAKWSLKQWNVLDGLKVNGAGSGYFEYRIPWPDNLDSNAIAQATFRVEASAKQLFGKDQENAAKQEGDFMLGGGTHDPSRNPNAYPMTDEEKFPSLVRVRAMGELAGSFELPDDSADHRGILSWHAQPRDKKLREAGSFGYLISAALTPEMLQKAKEQKELVIRLEVDAALPGGLAIYGENFGRYPLDPSVIFVMK